MQRWGAMWATWDMSSRLLFGGVAAAALVIGWRIGWRLTH
jgi:hypothetical protein